MRFDLRRDRCVALVVDVQELFASSDGPFANTTAGPMIDALNTFLDGCRELGVPVVFSNYVLRPDLRDAGLLAGAPFVERGQLSVGSPWVEVDRRIRKAELDVEVRHHRPSAFFASDLEAVLRSLSRDLLLLAGLSVNNAVSATARDAFARDLPAVVVRECVGVAPFEPAGELDVYFDVLDRWTAEVASAADVLERLRAG